MTSSLSWEDICFSLGNRDIANNVSQSLEGSILDTVLFDSKGDFKCHLSTQNGKHIVIIPHISKLLSLLLIIGCITNLDITNRNSIGVENNFLEFARKIQGNNFKYIATATRCNSNTIDFLDEDSFKTLLLTDRMNIQQIQTYVPSKGSRSSHRTYRYNLSHEFIYRISRSVNYIYFVSCVVEFDVDGRVKSKCERIDINPEISGSSHLLTSVNMDKIANEVSRHLILYSLFLYTFVKKMELLLKNLAACLQTSLRCRILSMSAEFVQDIHRNIWLMSTTDCKVQYASTKAKRCVRVLTSTACY
jgi:hypothetical protein